MSALNTKLHELTKRGTTQLSVSFRILGVGSDISRATDVSPKSVSIEILIDDFFREIRNTSRITSV